MLNRLQLELANYNKVILVYFSSFMHTELRELKNDFCDFRMTGLDDASWDLLLEEHTPHVPVPGNSLSSLTGQYLKLSERLLLEARSNFLKQQVPMLPPRLVECDMLQLARGSEWIRTECVYFLNNVGRHISDSELYRSLVTHIKSQQVSKTSSDPPADFSWDVDDGGLGSRGGD